MCGGLSMVNILIIILGIILLFGLFYYYLFIGLVFCLMGDVCLALPQEKA